VTAAGEHWRIEPQAWYYWGPLGILGEYIVSDQKVQRTGGATVLQSRAEHRGWQVQGSWFLTGEDNSFRTVNPLRPFTLGEGGWGAFQVVARLNQLSLDEQVFPVYANHDLSVSKATEWSVGINWYLNRIVRLSTSYSQTHYEGGAKNPAAARDEKVMISRVQLSF
jgi:phosphate-selective porin OprO/OprP